MWDKPHEVRGNTFFMRRFKPTSQNKTKFRQIKSPCQCKAVSFRGRQMVQGSWRAGPRSSTLKIERNFNFACVVLLLSIMIFVISLCCPFWPVLKHFVVSGTGTCWFISWKGKGVALKGMQRRKDDENIICAVSTRESKEEGKLKFHGNPGRTTMTASLRSGYTQISLATFLVVKQTAYIFSSPSLLNLTLLFTVSMTQLYPLPLLLYDFELLQTHVISSCILIRHFLEKIWTLQWQHSFWLPKHLCC